MATDVSSAAPVPAPPAATSTTVPPPEREQAQHKGRKPFSAIMKRLANFKSSSAQAHSKHPPSSTRPARVQQRAASFSTSHSYKGYENDPALSRASSNGHLSFAPSGSHHYAAPSTTHSVSSSSDGAEDGDESPTNAVSVNSRPAASATTATTSGFSSRTPSVRSLTTTLTTIQSTAPGSMLNANYNPHPTHHHNPNGPPQMFSHQFPSGSSQSPAYQDSTHQNGPPNGATYLQPVNYSSATANNLLTDNASIITLASSSKRQRRHSLDTDASVRALAPSSVFGGSRESLPLSVLSGNFDGSRSIAGERGSLYGSASYIAGTNRGGDTNSVRDTTGSIMEISAHPGTGSNGSPMISPTVASVRDRESMQLGRHSRRSSGWGNEIPGQDGDDDEGADRRSLSARSASLKGGDGEDTASVRDGSSNVGVWHGVHGHSAEGRPYSHGKENSNNYSNYADTIETASDVTEK